MENISTESEGGRLPLVKHQTLLSCFIWMPLKPPSQGPPPRRVQTQPLCSSRPGSESPPAPHPRHHAGSQTVGVPPTPPTPPCGPSRVINTVVQFVTIITRVGGLARVPSHLEKGQGVEKSFRAISVRRCVYSCKIAFLSKE